MKELFIFRIPAFSFQTTNGKSSHFNVWKSSQVGIKVTVGGKKQVKLCFKSEWNATLREATRLYEAVNLPCRGPLWFQTVWLKSRWLVPNMALLAITFTHAHVHAHTLSETHNRCWSFLLVFGLAPTLTPYYSAKANIPSVLELQFTWAHTFQLIYTWTYWLTCEQSWTGWGPVKHEVIQHKPAAGQPEGPEIISIWTFSLSLLHNFTTCCSDYLCYFDDIVYCVCCLRVTHGSMFTLENVI